MIQEQAVALSVRSRLTACAYPKQACVGGLLSVPVMSRQQEGLMKRMLGFLTAVCALAWLSLGSAQAETALLYSGPPSSDGNIAIRWTPPGTSGQPVNAIFQIFGSAYLANQGNSGAPAANPQMIGICMRVDGVDCAAGSTAQIFANIGQTHLALSPAVFSLPLRAGLLFAGLVVTIDSLTTRRTVWDANDRISVLVTW